MPNSESHPTIAAWRAAHLISRLARLRRAADFERGLNPVQWEALRYIARANRFSRTPAALAEFLSSSRGTVSQTLITLEGKGLIARNDHPRDGRSIELDLTAEGRRLLSEDGERLFAADIDVTGAAGPLSAVLEKALARSIARRGGRAFGSCKSCRHFRKAEGGETPFRCAFFNAPLSAPEAQAICAEMEAA